MHVDTSRWSGEGEFTALLLERLKQVAAIDSIRVEDAPSARAETGYNFVSNEVFVVFGRTVRRVRVRLFGILPASRKISMKAMTMPDLEAELAAVPDIGVPDYSDDAMLQFLRTERIVPPYQTRGYKLVELVRIYEVTGKNDVVQRSIRDSSS
jgi:hypothetical protein